MNVTYIYGFIKVNVTYRYGFIKVNVNIYIYGLLDIYIGCAEGYSNVNLILFNDIHIWIVYKLRVCFIVIYM